MYFISRERTMYNDMTSVSRSSVSHHFQQISLLDETASALQDVPTSAVHMRCLIDNS